jgi:FAS-associated factor 2
MSVITFFFQEIQRKKIEYQMHIPDEPPPNHPEAVHIVIKLPNGMRLERRFLQNHSLEVTASYNILYVVTEQDA